VETVCISSPVYYGHLSTSDVAISSGDKTTQYGETMYCIHVYLKMSFS